MWCIECDGGHHFLLSPTDLLEVSITNTGKPPPLSCITSFFRKKLNDITWWLSTWNLLVLFFLPNQLLLVFISFLKYHIPDMLFKYFLIYTPVRHWFEAKHKLNTDVYIWKIMPVPPYLEASTRREGAEELAVILPPWSTGRERVGSRRMWF